MRKLVYYVATSLDGFIADSSGDTSAFPIDPDLLAVLFSRYPETCPVHLQAPLGVSGTPARFDTVLMGYRTHEPALTAGLASGYPHLRQIVVSHRNLPPDPTLEVWSGDIAEQVHALKAESGHDIWLCGGGDLASQLIGQIDELQLKLNPVTLGQGVPLFTRTGMSSWRLDKAEPLPGGVTLLSYSAGEQ